MHKALYNEDGEYNFEEECPFCGEYIPVLIDEMDFNHYDIICPVCGKRMMLCTLCRWDQELEDGFDGNYKCDWSEAGCFRRKEEK